MPLDALIAADQ